MASTTFTRDRRPRRHHQAHEVLVDRQVGFFQDGAGVRRAGALASGKDLTVIKVSKPRQDMRFDVPVIGLPTIQLMAEVGASALAIDARKTLLLDRDQLIALANQHNICIMAGEPAGV